MNHPSGHYLRVNGLTMYFEIHGIGFPLVLLHGGGSTIDTTFGRILPELSKNHRIIAVELQAHGHTHDIDRPMTFEQDADDVAELLQKIGVRQADFMGFSNGGTTCLQVSIRHPALIRKLILASVIYKRSGMPPEFWKGMELASLENMPQPLKDEYLKANPDPAGLVAMFNRDRYRMLGFVDIPDDSIQKIKVPVLVINGDRDVVTTEHALELSRILSESRLVILPGEHGEYMGEICNLNPDHKISLLTAELLDAFLSGNLMNQGG